VAGTIIFSFNGTVTKDNDRDEAMNFEKGKNKVCEHFFNTKAIVYAVE
jgi:hypothetical protein